MRVALVLLVIAGCSLPKFRGGGAGDDDGPVDGPPQDGSGSGHDEDDDGKPDSVDPCPADPSPASNTDSDGDGVGDLCDPDPASGGDHEVFYSFASGDTGDLTVTAPGLVHGSDSIQIGDPTNTLQDSLFTPLQFDRAYVEVGYHMLTVGTGGSPGFEELEILTGHQGASQLDGSGCAIERQLQVATVHFYIEDGQGNQLAHDDRDYNPQGSSGKLHLIQGEGIVCTNARDANSPIMITGDNGIVHGAVGFYAVQMSVRIDYLFVAGK